MALYDTPRMGASGTGDTGYQIERSLKFDGSNGYLTRTPSSTGNRKVWTWSGWIKRGHLNNNDYIFSCNSQSGNDGIAALYFKSGNNRLQFYFDTSGANPYGDVNSRDYRDPTAWYHIVWQVDAANTSQRIWVNGVEESVTGGQPPNYDYAMNRSGYAHAMGSQSWDGHTNRADMYMAEVYYSDGNKYEASDFGEYDSETGVWSPKENVNITYGTNGFYLKFNDNSNNTATTIGKDSSGNGNNWTPNGISVSAGVGNDSVEDTPTNNFCTLNPLDMHSSVTTANGNLETNSTTGGSHFPIFSTMSMKGGKYYMEYKCKNADNGWNVQIMNIEHDAGSLNTDSTVGNNTSAVNKVGYGLLVGSGRIRHNTFLSSPGAYGSALAVNGAETGMCAVDLDNGKIWWGKQGTWFDSGDPAAGTNAAFTGIDTDISWNFCFHVLNNNNVSVNFGQKGFTYTPPNGFKALCSKNIATPIIKNPNDHIDTLLYTGNSSTNNITGLNFQPDLVWVKRRDSSSHHNVIDSVRGTQKHIQSSGAGSQDTETGSNGLTSFNSDGFTVSGTNSGTGRINYSGNTFVAWNWKAGGSASSNSNGSVTSSVSANATAGFSIVSWTGTGSAATIGHGLGVAPAWIIVKNLNDTANWTVYHERAFSGSFDPHDCFASLNETHAWTDSTAAWNETAPTSSVFSVGNSNQVNGSGDTLIAYCFSEVAGYSKFGQYIGNGSSNGPFVYLGFTPQWVMYKNVPQNGGQWFIRDNKRRTFNPHRITSAADSAGIEQNSSLIDIDFLSNGLKWRETNEGSNNSGRQYIFMAFAEAPINYSRAF